MALLVDLRRRIDRWRDAAQRDVVVERHVVADFRRLADHDAHAVVDEEPIADLHAGVNLDARQEAPEMRDEAPQKLEVAVPRPMRHAVELDRVKTRVAQNDLQARAHRRVALEDDIYIFAKSLEHYRSRRLIYRPA